MNKLSYMFLAGITIISFSSCNQDIEEPAFHSWPVMKAFNSKLTKSTEMTAGGIGTGTISITGEGEVTDLHIMNCPTEELFTKEDVILPFFMIYVRPDGGNASVRRLSVVPRENKNKNQKTAVRLRQDFQGFKKASFETAYPFGVTHLKDSRMPVEVSIKTFNPLIPGEAGPSSIPMAVIIYEVKNITKTMAEVSVCGAMENFIGKGCEFTSDHVSASPVDSSLLWNRNAYVEFGDVQGIYMVSDNKFIKDSNKGTIALSTAMADSVSYITSIQGESSDECLALLWNDFRSDGTLSKANETNVSRPLAALSTKQFLAPGETRYFRFFITWHFPFRSESLSQNYYSADYTNAWDVAKKVTPYLPSLEEQNILFIRLLKENDIPTALTEPAVNNLAGLRSVSYFRNKEGEMDFSRCNDSADRMRSGFSLVKYDFSFPYLFGRLSKTISVGALRNTADSFEDSFSSVMKFFNDWQLSGDTAFLADNWGTVRNAILRSQEKTGPDTDKDGVCDNLKTSFEAPIASNDLFRLQFFYLGALKAASIMAGNAKDTLMARYTLKLYEDGTRWTNLAMRSSAVNNFTINSFTGLLVARICGLGSITDPEILRKYLRRVYSENIAKNFPSVAASGIYAGDEYSTAALCIYEGLTDEGINWIAKIRNRYDGKAGDYKKDSAERCYEAISLVSWAGIISYTQFNYSRVTGTMSFSSRPGKYFWSDGYAWGTVKINESEGAMTDVEVQVYSGELRLKKFTLNEFGERDLSKDDFLLIKSGETLPFTILRKK